jgi:hypothetical protein
MRGLVPRIHVFRAAAKAWMAGTSPAMTTPLIADGLVADARPYSGLIPFATITARQRSDSCLKKAAVSAGELPTGLAE